MTGASTTAAAADARTDGTGDPHPWVREMSTAAPTAAPTARPPVPATALADLLVRVRRGRGSTPVRRATNAAGDERPEVADASEIDGPTTSDAEAALEELLAQLYEPVLQFVRNRARRHRDGEDLAADIAQETLIRLARAAEDCRAVTNTQVLAWALTTARHVLIDAWRSPEWRLAGARGPASEAASEAEWHTLAQSFEESAGHASEVTPACAILLRLAVEACDAARDGVAALCWTRLVAGADWAQIAGTFGTTEYAIKRRFQRAVGSMRRDVLRRVATLDQSEQTAVREFLLQRGLLPGV